MKNNGRRKCEFLRELSKSMNTEVLKDIIDNRGIDMEIDDTPLYAVGSENADYMLKGDWCATTIPFKFLNAMESLKYLRESLTYYEGMTPEEIDENFMDFQQLKFFVSRYGTNEREKYISGEVPCVRDMLTLNWIERYATHEILMDSISSYRYRFRSSYDMLSRYDFQTTLVKDVFKHHELRFRDSLDFITNQSCGLEFDAQSLFDPVIEIKDYFPFEYNYQSLNDFYEHTLNMKVAYQIINDEHFRFIFDLEPLDVVSRSDEEIDHERLKKILDRASKMGYLDEKSRNFAINKLREEEGYCSNDSEETLLSEIPEISESDKIVSDFNQRVIEFKDRFCNEFDDHKDYIVYGVNILNVFVACYHLSETTASRSLRMQNLYGAIETFTSNCLGLSVYKVISQMKRTVTIGGTIDHLWNKCVSRSSDTVIGFLNTLESSDVLKSLKDIMHFSVIHKFVDDNRVTSAMFGKVSSAKYSELNVISVLRSFAELLDALTLSVSQLVKQGYVDSDVLYNKSNVSGYLRDVPKLLNLSLTPESIDSISHEVKEYIDAYPITHCDAMASRNNVLIGRVESLYQSLLATEGTIREILSGQIVGKAPYVYIANGPSSVGKTTVVEYISAAVMQALGVDISKPHTYIVQNIPGKPWMLNFHEITGKELRFDDLAQFIEDPESMSTFLQVSGNLVTCAPLPEADKMGKHKVRPELISVTSNVADVKMENKFCFADAYWRCPAAFARRFHTVIDVRLRPEFVSPTGGIDKGKCNECVGAIPDAWLINVYVPRLGPVDEDDASFNQDIIFECKLRNASIFEVMRFIVASAIAERNQQATLVERLKETKDGRNFTMCEHGKFPGEKPECEVCYSQLTRSAAGSIDINLSRGQESSVMSYFRGGYRSKQPQSVRRKLMNWYATRAPRWMYYYPIKTYLYIYGITLDYSFDGITPLKEAIKVDFENNYKLGRRKIGDWYEKPLVQASVKMFVLFLQITCVALVTSLSGLAVVRTCQAIDRRLTPEDDKNKSNSEYSAIPTVEDKKNLETKYRTSDDQPKIVVRDISLRDSILPNNPKQMLSTVEDNIFAVSIETSGKRRINIGLYVHGHVIMTVKHMFRGVNLTKGEQIRVDFLAFRRGKYHRDHSEILCGSNFHFIEDKDVVFIRTTACKNKKKVHLFPNDPMLQPAYKGDCFLRQYHYKQDFTYVDNNLVVAPYDKVTYQLGASNESYTIKRDVYKSLVECKDGNCGSPLIATGLSKNFILGIVIASSRTHNDCYFQAVRRSEVEEAISVLDKQNVDLGSSRCLEEPLLVSGYSPCINPKSELKYVEGDNVGHIDILGSVPNKRGPQKPSMVVKSLINPIGEIKHCGPMLKHGNYREYEGYFKPYWNMLQYSLISPKLPMGSLRVCANDVADSFISNITIGYIQKNVHPIPVEDAMFGVDGVAYLNKINGNASSGDPDYRLNRSFYDLDKRTIDPLILEYVSKIKERAITDSSAMVTFNVLLKDEVLKESKKFKPRLFTGGSLPLLLVSKQMLGMACRMIMLNRMKFETVQGLNVESPEWGELYNELTQFGPERIVAGDFSKFDKNIHKGAIRLAFGILRKICVLSGNYDARELRILDLVIDAISDPVYSMYGTLFMLSCGEPSGHFLTTTINSIVVSMYIRLAWLHEFGEVQTFRENVCLYTMGDDHIMGIKKNGFGFDIIKNRLGDCGIIYTGNDKSGPDPERLTHIDRCDFLKRKFTYEDYPYKKYGIMTSPIEMDTIYKVLNFYVDSKAMTPLEHTIECVTNALEFLAHHGESVYNSFGGKIHKKIKEVYPYYNYLSYTEMWDKIATRRAYRREFITNNAEDNGHSSDNVARSYEFNNSDMDNTMIGSDSSLNKSTPVSTGDLQQNLVFVDDAGIVKKEYEKGSQNGLICSIQPMTELGDFFRRPIKINTTNWTGADAELSFLTTLNPWALWLNDPIIKNKLQSYRNFRGDMHLRFTINSNKFLYGTVAIYYEPLYDLSTYTVRTRYTSGSQCPGVRLGTSHNFTQEMELPFVWITDWFEITKAASLTRTLGRLRYQIINQLRSVSAITSATDSVEISTFCWMENIQLSGPTMIDTVSASDESELKEASGVLSGPASAVASVSGAVANTMGDSLIGRLARSTEIGSSAMSGIARLWGFSKPNIIDGNDMIKQNPFGNTAVCLGGDPAVKLTVDPKQELTIDGTYTGLTNSDDMAIHAVACRESYIGNFDFSTLVTTDQQIQSIAVRPIMPTTIASPNLDSGMELPAITFATLPFEYWRGSIDYRFEIVCTPFHKGRLRFTYEPSSDVVTPGTVYNRNFSHIIDISETTDFSIRVEWSQPEHWKPVNAAEILPQDNNPGDTYHLYANNISDVDNGQIKVNVVNELSIPDRSLSFLPTAVYINVYVKAGPDFQLSVPTTEAINRLCAFPIGAASLEIVARTMEDEVIPEKQIVQDDQECCTSPMMSPEPDANLVYFGETIQSFRTLVKRYAYLAAVRYPSTVLQSATQNYKIKIPRFPLLPGDAANGVYNNGTFNTNVVGWTFASYLSLGYVTERGSLRYKMVTTRPGNTGMTGVVTRFPWFPVEGVSEFYNTTAGDIYLVADTDYNLNKKYLADNVTSGNGSFLCDIGNQPGVEFEVPFQTNIRFRPASDRDRTYNSKFLLFTDAYDQTAIVSINSFSDSAGLNDVRKYLHAFYCAAGEDFNLHWFVGAATVYSYTL